jgi:hypothetical protein
MPAKGFLDLAPEVRNMIYTEALTTPLGIGPDLRRGAVRSIAYPGHHFGFAAAGILLANRQISQEACDILYGQNTFVFSQTRSYEPEKGDHPSDFKMILLWFKWIGHNNRRRLRHVVFQLDQELVLPIFSEVPTQNDKWLVALCLFMAQTLSTLDDLTVFKARPLRHWRPASREYWRHSHCIDIDDHDFLDAMGSLSTRMLCLPSHKILFGATHGFQYWERVFEVGNHITENAARYLATRLRLGRLEDLSPATRSDLETVLTPNARSSDGMASTNPY